MNDAERSPVRVNPAVRHAAERAMKLDGGWLFRLDPDDQGVKQQWFRKPALFREPINVPGCWQGQGFGGDGDDDIWDFRVSTRVFRATYEGTGWYCRRLFGGNIGRRFRRYSELC